MRDCYLLLMSVLILSSSSSGCNSSGVPARSVAPETDKVKLRSVAAILNEAPERLVEVATAAIGSSRELKDAQFIDVNNGWAADRRLLYKTSSAGKNWKKLNPNLPPDSYISSFFFVNPTRGWLTVIHKDETKGYGRGYFSSIMVTGDGGETWVEQSVFRDEVSLRHLGFWDTERGIAIGGKTTGSELTQGEIFAVETDDGGKTWKDLTPRLKPAIKSPYGFGYDYGRRIHWLSSSQIFLLTVDDRVLTSDDSGETWKSIVHFEELHSNGSPKATTYYKMLFDAAGRLRLLGGQQGDEGYWADFVVSEGNASWESYELIRVPLLDAVFLSGNELLACGKELRPRVPESSTPQSSVGIVLYSKDSGKNWSPIYRTKSSETLIHLTKISDTDFYAVSDSGNFLKLTLKQRQGSHQVD